MKVCHMTSAHNPEDVRIFHKECVSLAKNGYDVYLVARGDSYEKKGVHVVGVGTIPDSRLQRMTQGARRVYEAALALDCDIYHFHDPELLPYGVMLKKKGKKVIFDSHECYSLQIANKPYLGKLAPLVAKLYTRYENHVLAAIDAVIFPCLMDGVNPFEGRCGKIALVGNQPLLEEIYSEEERSFEGEQSACYVGGLRYDRGITQDALACNKVGIKLLLAGEVSSEEYKQELIGLDEKNLIQFLGILNRAEVAALLKKATIGLVTELNIGQNNKIDILPTKTYEYMGSGLPVITAKSDYVDRMLEQYGFGISVDPENVDQIAQAIRYLLDHPEEARRMGENGRRAVKENFNWDVEEQKLLRLYEELKN